MGGRQRCAQANTLLMPDLAHRATTATLTGPELELVEVGVAAAGAVVGVAVALQAGLAVHHHLRGAAPCTERGREGAIVEPSRGPRKGLACGSLPWRRPGSHTDVGAFSGTEQAAAPCGPSAQSSPTVAPALHPQW